MNLLELQQAKGLTCKRVSDTNGGEWHSPCPACGGKDRFHFWPYREVTTNCHVAGVWGCRQCDDSGDTIAYLMRYDGMTFPEACKAIGQKIEFTPYKPVTLRKKAEQREAFTPNALDLPPEAWIAQNTKLATYATKTLLKTPSQRAWLAARGIDEDAIQEFHLGWLPGEKKGQGTSGNRLGNGSGNALGNDTWYTRPLKSWGLHDPEGKKRLFKFPRGLVIPRLDTDGRVIAMRIRRLSEDRKLFAPDTKYMAFKGAKARPLLLMPAHLPPEAVCLVVVESELDAYLVFTIVRRCNLPIGVLALLSNTAKPCADIHPICQRVARILLCLDFEEAGSKAMEYTSKALEWWLTTYARTKVFPVPAGKDPGEAYALGVDLGLWLQVGLPLTMRPAHGRSVALSPTPAPALTPASTPSSIEPQGVENTPESEGGTEQAHMPQEDLQSPEIAPSEQTAHTVLADDAAVAKVYEAMQKQGLFLRRETSPFRFGVEIGSEWKAAHWDEWCALLDIIMEHPAMDSWLARHPVQDGIINATNFYEGRDERY